MGWGLGWDSNWNRDIGYGVPAYCDYPGCGEEIDRGLAYVCADQEPYGGENGCGLYFCGKHLKPFACERCIEGKDPFNPTGEHPKWLKWKLTDKSWKAYREEHPSEVKQWRKAVKKTA